MPQSTVLIIGDSPWIDEHLKTTLNDYDVVHQPKPHQVMRTLIDHRVAMLFVDATLTNWDKLTVTPKSNAATRRIPIVLISDDASTREQALKQGADFALNVADVIEHASQLVEQSGRIISEQLAETLNLDCQSPLPEKARSGIEKFNAGEYYQQHDLFEELWMETASPVRDLYRAILQVGVAYYQIQRGNHRGAVKMIERSTQWLLLLPDSCQGVNIKQLREDAFAVRSALEELGEDGIEDFDFSLIRGVQWVDSSV